MLRISRLRTSRRGGAAELRKRGGISARVSRLIAAIALLTPTLALAAGTCSLESITAAERTYDLQAGRSVLDACSLEASGAGDEILSENLARAALLVAELYRIDFEELPPSQKKQRREFGESIDAAADTGLEALASLPETSCRQRIRADLLATKIRSDFRAKKYAKEMEAAAARALELDPGNARAMVTLAKPPLFADDRHGRDLDEAIRVLSDALAIDPTVESALLLRALAFEMQGETEACQRDLEAALAANPDCRPANERLLATAPPSAGSQPD
jgi:tetratricopeptide (TPR) repeat protein